jgi:hypothetical protein
MATPKNPTPSGYDIMRALRSGQRPVTIAHPGDGGAPWTLLEIWATDKGVTLDIQREGSTRHETVRLDVTAHERR